MSSQSRLDNAYKKAIRIPFSKQDKIIILSDCHRGDGSFADDFANNRNVYFHALKQYYNEGFQYIELGDGDELWENMFFKDLFEANKNVYLLLQKFYLDNKLHMIYGNHDMVYQNENTIKKNFSEYFDTIEGIKKPLMPHLKYHEGIVLVNSETQQELFLTHGHQADFMNYVAWKFSRLLVRVLWRPLQVWGIKDPTSPAKNYLEQIKVEKRVKEWIVNNNNKMTVIGHTHRPHMPQPTKETINYFNSGSCMHPRSITGIEIVNNTIALIKWFIDTKDDGTLQIVKEFIETPKPLDKFN